MDGKKACTVVLVCTHRFSLMCWDNFFNWAGSDHNACFALCGFCLLFSLFAFSVVASCLVRHCDHHPGLWSLPLYQPFHCWAHGAPCWLLYHGSIATVNSFHALVCLIDLTKAKRRWTEKSDVLGQFRTGFGTWDGRRPSCRRLRMTL